MRAIILAGGFGTRIAAVAGEKPKPLVEVAGKTILEHQIDFLAGLGVSDIRLSLHHKAEQIIAFSQERWPGPTSIHTRRDAAGNGRSRQIRNAGL